MATASQANDSNSTDDQKGDATGQPAVPPGESSSAPLLVDASQALFDVHGRRHLWRGILLWVIFIALVASGVTLWLQRDVVLDWVHTRGYVAPQSIVQLADRTTMTPYAKRLFYVNYPAVEDKDAFNKDCPDASHEVAVLGCYAGNRNGIYLYHVTDTRLAGITEVTAAHEMLHQGFDRLPKAERTRISGLLTDYYEHQLSDKDVKDKIASYKKLEPNDVVNEMHSVFGTEVATLPPALETYYKQYFTNRGMVVAYRNRYVSAFSQRQQQIDQYDQQREVLKKQIDQAQAELDNWEKTLRTQRDQMNAYLSADKVDEYNALVPGFNAQVAAYKRKVTNTNALINEYNTATDKRNALTAQEQELIKAQDSHAASADTE